MNDQRVSIFLQAVLQDAPNNVGCMACVAFGTPWVAFLIWLGILLQDATAGVVLFLVGYLSTIGAMIYFARCSYARWFQKRVIQSGDQLGIDPQVLLQHLQRLGNITQPELLNSRAREMLHRLPILQRLVQKHEASRRGNRYASGRGDGQPISIDPTNDTIAWLWERAGGHRSDRGRWLLHRATVGVILGGLSPVVLLPSLIALPMCVRIWWMARHDLMKMREEATDAVGRYETSLARTLAVVGICLNALGLLGGAVVLYALWFLGLGK